jgi:hypothetical protein
MLRLRNSAGAPPGGYGFQDRATGWRTHSWSLQVTKGAWYQENVRRQTGRTKEQCHDDVEGFIINNLLKLEGFTKWIVTDEVFNPDDISDLGSYVRESSSPTVAGQSFAVVFPFCRMDETPALKLMQWMAELGPYHHECVLSFDYSASRATVDAIELVAKTCFAKVDRFNYSGPSSGSWQPTIAFREAALHMEKLGLPFLWMEADAVPLRPGWLDKLQELYWGCGKAFAGPIVPDLGHMNGTGIYPANTPKRIPAALAHIRTAWDVMMKREMIGDCFNLHPYFYHAWAMEGGELHPYAGGAVPSFGTQKMVAQIPAEAVVFHRCKDLSLIDRLRERKAADTFPKQCPDCGENIYNQIHADTHTHGQP